MAADRLQREVDWLKGQVAELVLAIASLTRANESLLLATRRDVKPRKPEPSQLTLTPETEPVESPFAKLRDAMVSTFKNVRGADYVFKGAKDASALNRMLATNVHAADIVRRWESALRNAVPAIGDIAQFEMRWNSLGAARSADVRRGAVRADAVNSAALAKAGEQKW